GTGCLLPLHRRVAQTGRLRRPGVPQDLIIACTSLTGATDILAHRWAQVLGRRSRRRCRALVLRARGPLLVGERVVLPAGVVATLLPHERRRASPDAPALGRAHVLVLVPGEAHRVVRLIDENEVLHAGGTVSVELDHWHVADELAARGGSQQLGHA